MRKQCTDPIGIWKQVTEARDYNQSIDLYETVKRNEAFYTGEQWRNLGEKTPDLLLVTLNFLQRVVSMFVAKVASDDFGANFTAFNETDETAATMRMLSEKVDEVIELTDLRKQNKVHVRDCAVDGDTCAYFWWDADAPTGQKAKGAIRVENVESMNVLFGNPYESRPDRQPYIILLLRKPVHEVREEAIENGIPEDDTLSIRPDQDADLEESGNDNKLCTVAVKLWKAEDGHIWCVKSTDKCLVREAWDTDLTRYPIAWMTWEKVRNQYHGRAALTGLIPNQIALNSTYSSIITQIRNTAFNKLIYSDAVGKWNPSPAAAIKVNGAIDVSKVATYLQGATVNPSITNVMDNLVGLTREFMGASDATMGDMRPDNASAIIALQSADEYPMEMHRHEFYSFIEQEIRVIIDMMRAYYGKREVIELMRDPQTDALVRVLTEYDFGDLSDTNLKVHIDVGTASYWDETLQVTTLNNIFTSGIMQDPETFSLFLEVMPDKYVPKKQKLIDYAKRKKEEAEAAQQAPAGPQAQMQ